MVVLVVEVVVVVGVVDVVVVVGIVIVLAKGDVFRRITGSLGNEGNLKMCSFTLSFENDLVVTCKGGGVVVCRMEENEESDEVLGRPRFRMELKSTVEDEEVLVFLYMFFQKLRRDAGSELEPGEVSDSSY